jgi:hypothetical protein
MQLNSHKAPRQTKREQEGKRAQAQINVFRYLGKPRRRVSGYSSGQKNTQGHQVQNEQELLADEFTLDIPAAHLSGTPTPPRKNGRIAQDSHDGNQKACKNGKERSDQGLCMLVPMDERLTNPRRTNRHRGCARNRNDQASIYGHRSLLKGTCALQLVKKLAEFMPSVVMVKSFAMLPDLSAFSDDDLLRRDLFAR